MKKFWSRFFLLTALLNAPLLAFVNGPQDSTTPWNNPVPGAIFVTFNVQGDAVVYQKLNDDSPTPRRINVSTLKIGALTLSQDYAAPGTVLTVSYTVENTGASAVSGITPALNFFKTALGSGNLVNTNFTVSTIAAYNLNAGASNTNTFRVTVNSISPGDVFVVDGVLSAPAGSKDQYWQHANILSNAWQSGAAQTRSFTALAAAVTVNAGAEFTGSRAVNLSLSLTPPPVGQVNVWARDNSGAFTDLGAYSSPLAYTIQSAGDGLKTIEVRFTDVAGTTIYAAAADSIKLDMTQPSAVADQGRRPTGNAVTLNLTWPAASDPLSGNVASGVSTYNIYWGTSDAGNSPYTPRSAAMGLAYDTPQISSAPLRQELYYLRIQTVDAMGNASAWQTVWIYPFDNVPPTGAVTINAGAEYTSSNAVTLTLGYSAKVAAMYIEGTGSAPAGPLPAQASYAWTFGSGDGEKTVTVTYSDSAGNTFNATDNIKLDRTAPGVVNAQGALPVSNNPTPVFNWTPTNDPVVNGVASGLTTYNIYFGELANGEIITASTPSTSAAYAPVITGALNTTFYLRVQAIDAVGNKSAWSTVWEYPFNNLPPTGAVTINAGDPEYTSVNSVTLYLNYAANVVSMNIESTDGNPPSGIIAAQPQQAWVFGANDGEKSVTVTYYDAVGNAAAVTDTIKLDTTSPDAVIYAGRQTTSNITNPVLNWTAAVDPPSGNVASGVATYNVYWGVSSAGTSPHTAQAAANLSYTAAINPVPSRNETYYLRLQTVDAVGNAGGWQTVWEYPFDNVEPTGSVTINGGAIYTTSNSVALDLSYAADVVSMNIEDSDGNTSSGLLAVSPTLPWTFAALDGEKTVTVTYYDFAGNTVAVSDKIILDTMPPTGAVTINAGDPEYTSVNNVTLYLSYSADAVSMSIEGTDGNPPSGLLAVSPTLPWAFAAVDGEKTVTVTYYDHAGNTANAVDTIILDTVSPNLISVNHFTLAPVVSDFELILEFSETMDISTTPSLSIAADIGVVSISDYRGWSSGGAASSNIYTFALDLTAVGGQITLNLLDTPDSARDRAGNIVNASPNFAVFYVDSIKPTGGVTINNGEIATSNPLVEIALGVWDDRSAALNMEFMLLAPPLSPASDVSANPGLTLNVWLPYQPTFAVNLSDGAGSKNIYVLFKDEAGNTSSVYSDDIFLDSDEILWLTPATAAALVSGQVEIKVQLVSTRNVAALDFYVSANGSLGLVSQNVPYTAAGLSSALWDTLAAANPYSGVSARDVELLVVISKNGNLITANPLNIVTVDNTTPSITLLTPWPDLRHIMAGTVTLSGTATDNGAVTSVNQVEIFITSNGLADFQAAAAVDPAGGWSYSGWSIADTTPVGTTFNIAVWTYDAAGNRSDTVSVRVIRTDQVAVIEVSPPPTQSITWLNPAYEVTFNGLVDSSMELTGNLLATFNSISKLAPFSQLGMGPWPWQVTFDITALAGAVVGSPGLTLEMLTETSPNGSVVTRNFTYFVDGRAPTLSAFSVPSTTYPAVGTLNITGNFSDDSGLSEVQVSLNDSIVATFSAADFSWLINVSANTTIAFRALDNAYPSPNASNWVSVDLIYDTTLLPSGEIVSPVSGSYVNNAMLVTGTAAVKDGSSVAQVWLDLGAGWVTANIARQYAPTADWEYLWQVPTPDQEHGRIFAVSMNVLSARGMQAEVSPQPAAIYSKDIYGPTANFLNLANGIFLAQTPFKLLAQTYTEGAFVSAVYFIVDGVTVSALTPGGSLASANVSWNYTWDWDGKTHEVMLRAVDRVNNWTDTPTLSVRSTADVITEPLPPDGVIVLPNNGGVFATSRNYVLVAASADLTAYTIQTAPAGVDNPVFTVRPSPVKDSNNNYIVTYNNSSDAEIIYLLSFISANGMVEYQQLVVYDISAPQISYNMLTRSKYYPDALIALEQVFEFLVVDRVYDQVRQEYTDRQGSGFTAAPSFNQISSENLSAAGANTILRSIFVSGTTLDAVTKFKNESFAPQDEKLTFQASLAKNSVYDVALYAVDNAGNALNVDLEVLLAGNKLEILDAAAATRNAFIIRGLRVSDTASGESGGLDKSKFITAYPNPYDPNESDVLFTYYLKDNARKARIMVYNQLGEMLHIITVNGPGQEGTRAGYNAVPWDGLDRFDRIISSGVYIYLIVIDGDKGQTSVKGTMAVIKH
jgi:hypothetical protein